MKLRSFVFLAIIVLAACGPAKPGTPATSPSATTSPGSPSATPQPSVTPTAPPAFTPTPGVSPLLAILEADCFDDYPPAIELPVDNWKRYRLKPWSREAAFELIRTIDANSPPCNQNWTFSLPVYQNTRRYAAQLAVEEALLRYPEDPNRDLLEWRRTLNNALLGRYTSDEWVLARLLQALNEGRVTPETLANYVALYGFEIVQAETVVNLFGDGKIAYVHQLSTHVSSSDGIYFAVQNNPDQTYSLHPLSTGWSLLGSAGSEFSLGDHTQDGIPEIAVYRAQQNGMFCWDIMHVYQWNQDQFEDLTIQGLESGDSGCETWFDEPDPRGFDTIHTVTGFPGDHHTYEWNGSFYELADTDTSYPAKEDWLIKDQIQTFNENGKFSEAEKLTRQALANFQNVYVNPELKYNFRDYLLFQRGWVKALQMDVAGATEIFQSLASSPTEPGNVIVSRAAQDFLEAYAAEQDLYRACQAANLRMARNASESICDLPTALVLLSRSWTAAQYLDPLATLEAYGVQIDSSLRVDLDGDGREDWIFSVKKPWQEPGDLYVLRVGESGSSLAYLTQAGESPAPFQVNAATLPSQERPTVFLQSGRDFYLLQVVPGVHRLSRYFVNVFRDVRNVEFSEDDHFRFKINYFPDEYTPDWEAYEWNEIFQEFYMVADQRSAAQRYEDGPVAAAGQAEAKLLGEANPADAIPLLKQVLAMPGTYAEGCPPDVCVDRSRLRYLLALSYELTGEEAKAVQIYWQLWHDDPGSAYAVLARGKLEPQK
jgi:hypothetical protein